MKKSQLKTAFSFIVGMTMMGVMACSDASKTEDSKVVSEEHNEAKFENTKIEPDAQFLVDAAEINLEEIKLSNLALDRSTNDDVKGLAKMISDSHTSSMNDLVGLASKKTISIPTTATNDAEKAYEKLMNKTGNDFDKEYCEMMVKGHKDAISIFSTASTESVDMDIKNWAISTLPNLRAHSDQAINCQSKLK